ncbi:Heterokaryon incompatibility [Niveomyces insectorum RCEF 264]|uniref:Heterokaryon incompatibility n=1 Tax=Niveomyces insectorum RCEF 264 TaxID=1081102 RepID=A0A167QZI6_9HYPO|nr:Heterokaryon incompatibility [Niveomyces insectorum RCEF 264]
MHFIDVSTTGLTYFNGPPDRYAILSHRWADDDDKEVSYGEMTDETFANMVDDVRLGEAGQFKEKHVSIQKVHGCCEQAKLDNIRYVWIDSVCIMSTNLVQRSQEMKAMYGLYENATICYAYLSDVPRIASPHFLSPNIGSSEWFKRGWTLQELVAPSKLIFYSRDWTHIGTRQELAAQVEQVTGIPKAVLARTIELKDTSIAQRLSWAIGRRTGKVKDIVYCLAGLCDVDMDMKRDEDATRAFIRLQEAIMRNTHDHSILAWGLMKQFSGPSNSTINDGNWPEGVLASRSSDFANCRDIVAHHGPDVAPLTLYDDCLKTKLTVVVFQDGITYGLLKCSPKKCDLDRCSAEKCSCWKQVLAIPLLAVHSSGVGSNEYVRAPCTSCIVLDFEPTARNTPGRSPIPTKSSSLADISIRRLLNKGAISPPKFLVSLDLSKTGLKLIDTYPSNDWSETSVPLPRKDAAIPNVQGSEAARKCYLARIRPTHGHVLKDAVIVIKHRFGEQLSVPTCHMMLLSEHTGLDRLHAKIDSLRGNALANHAVDFGGMIVTGTLKFKGDAAHFVVHFETHNLPVKMTTVDADEELEHANCKFSKY